jgi:hypothetical protein
MKEYYVHYENTHNTHNKFEKFVDTLMRMMDKDVVTSEKIKSDFELLKETIISEHDASFKRCGKINISIFNPCGNDGFIISAEFARVIYYPIDRKDKYNG